MPSTNWGNPFLELNVQNVQEQVRKTALQNQLVLDMLLSKEQGICGMLNLTETQGCITIHNAASSIEEGQAKMKEITNQISEFFQSLQTQG